MTPNFRVEVSLFYKIKIQSETGVTLVHSVFFYLQLADQKIFLFICHGLSEQGIKQYHSIVILLSVIMWKN